MTVRMSKSLNKLLDYANTTSLVFLGTDSGASIFSFTTVIGIPVAKGSASISLVFLVTHGIVKLFLKTMERKM